MNFLLLDMVRLDFDEGLPLAIWFESFFGIEDKTRSVFKNSLPWGGLGRGLKFPNFNGAETDFVSVVL